MRYALLLISPLFLGGCLAFAAGAVGGSMADDESAEQIDYYITTNAPPDSIAQAMRREHVTLGMDKKEVRLVTDANDLFKGTPQVDTLDSREKWSFPPSATHPRPEGPVIVIFDSTGTVVKDNVE